MVETNYFTIFSQAKLNSEFGLMKKTKDFNQNQCLILCKINLTQTLVRSFQFTEVLRFLNSDMVV